MVENCRQFLDFSGYSSEAATVLTILSKAFDCINHEFLIAKLNAYGFDNLSLFFIYLYLSKRSQRTKINSCFTCWAEILFGITNIIICSILGPVLFNAYICDTLALLMILPYILVYLT